MLSEDTLKALAEPMAYRLEQFNTYVLKDIGERIKEIGEIKPSDIDKLRKLKRYGADTGSIITELERISKLNARDIEHMLNETAKYNYNSLAALVEFKGKPFVPYAENIVIQRYVKAMAKQTGSTYINMSQNTGFMVYRGRNKVFTSLSETYSDIIDRAVIAVTTGTEDFYSVMRKSLKEMADSGVRTKYMPLSGSAGKTVDYASGYSRRLDTAVRQNILWGAKMCYQGIAEEVGEEFGADGYEIDYHPNPRPSHAEMGGRMYAAGRGKRVDGIYYPSISTVQPLLDDYGCLHSKTPVILGVSPPTIDKKQLERLKESDRQKLEYEGKKYTGYEATQVQRKLETAARHAKDRQNIAAAAGDDTLRREEQAKLNAITNQYKKFSNAMGLPTKPERMSVSGYHRVKTQSQLWTTEVKGTKTYNGIMITEVSQHFYDQAKKRGILDITTKDNIVNTLTKPLNIGKIKTDNEGRSSQRFVGEKLSISINNDTGVLVTVWQTSSKRANKYKRDMDE